MTVRDAVREDYPAIARLMRFTHQIALDEEKLEGMERQRNKQFPFLLQVAEIDGQIVGYAKSQRRGETEPIRYMLSLAVEPEFRRQQIGRKLYEIASGHAISAGAEILRVQTAVGDSIARAFAERRGFRESFFVQNLSLDLESFDSSSFEGALKKAAANGIRFVPFQDNPENRQRLYELTLELSVDIPNVSDEPPPTYEDWERATFHAPWSDTDGITVALHGDQWIGFATVGRLEDGVFANSMTGIIRSHRGRGLALALKVRAIELARAKGGRELQTQNHGTNEAMRALNKRLDYRAGMGWHTHQRVV